MPENVPLGERSAVTIREDTKGRILLTGLHQVTINSIEDLLAALNFGSSIRQTDSTAINAKSSRSHAVFSLNLIQRRNKAQASSTQEKRLSVPIEALASSEYWVTVDSKLNFVDLAGSERLKNTGASGDRAKEGISINGGLASLGKVISQLSSRQSGSHVSYRDSKLTRLLQDSLGGNAITYMIACVTPAEFHLSETLNTVQYAQRARAIQSKPRIQQISDESDKQAVIDRLRAEVSFLREQIRTSERGDRRGNVPQERTERQNEREIELQNHLLDVQENYTALSQRHAKLISEITKARDSESGETPTLTEAIGDSAVERLKRSNSFAEAVEQVVLEYEKTIQSLETSLSNTRSSLATTESSLLEKETKYAYVETINQQLQNRVQKMMDRESSTDHYLHDLEARLDGHSSGEEKNSVIVTELRREIARVRETEASCEDYISTLEERLADRDQDTELMQREIDRLEHVIERQRSLGKLDNLIHELDHIQHNGRTQDNHHANNHLTNGSSLDPDATLQEAVDTAVPESDEEDEEYTSTLTPESLESEQMDDVPAGDETIRSKEMTRPDFERTTTADYPRQSPAQSKFIADKLETVSQELFDLRVEHESTVNEYDLMSAKYEEALRTLAELQDAVDEGRHSTPISVVASPTSTRTTSFLGDARMNLLRDGRQSSFSRSLSSELSLAVRSPSATESLDAQIAFKSGIMDASRTARKEEALSQELEHLKILQAEKDEDMAALNEKNAQLQEQHFETLDIVEELKAEVQKAKMSGPISPTKPSARTKASQNVMNMDRAHRSLASLQNIAADNFEDEPDTMQNFEHNLNTAMHELHQRSERVQALETELAGVRKEMEMKTTIISGLTRERSSLKGTSPIDVSIASSMRDQLLHNENQMKMLQEEYASREQNLIHQVESLKEALNKHVASTHFDMPGVYPETPAADDTESKELGHRNVLTPARKSNSITKLQDELELWEDRHQATVESMQASEKQLISTIAELEASLAAVEAKQDNKSSENATLGRSIPSDASEDVGAKQKEPVGLLQKEIDKQKATIASQTDQIRDLESSRAALREKIEEGTSSHRRHILSLEKEIQERQSDIDFHKHGLKSLHDSQAREIESIRSSTLSKAEADWEARLSEMSVDHERNIQEMRTELEKAKSDWAQLKGEAEKLSTDITEREHQSVRQDRAAATQEQTLEARLSEETDAKNKAILEKESSADEIAKLRESLEELKRSNADAHSAFQAVSEREKKASRLVDELEEQIANTYDQHQAASSRLSRLSVIHSQRDHALDEANAARAQLEEELDIYRSRLEQLEVNQISDTTVGQSLTTSKTQSRGPFFHNDSLQVRDSSNSSMSNARKSASVADLPSPPPAIPLPPLPNSAINVNSPGMSPPTSNHTSKELVSAQLVEDQEARIRTIEKHLFAEKQLTATLEEALVDLETQGNKVKSDMEAWKKKAWSYEDELVSLRKERNSTRYSLQAVEEERNARKEAEAARAHLEERMNAINKKKKKSGFNCF